MELPIGISAVAVSVIQPLGSFSDRNLCMWACVGMFGFSPKGQRSEPTPNLVFRFGCCAVLCCAKELRDLGSSHGDELPA